VEKRHTCSQQSPHVTCGIEPGGLKIIIQNNRYLLASITCPYQRLTFGANKGQIISLKLTAAQIMVSIGFQAQARLTYCNQELSFYARLNLYYKRSCVYFETMCKAYEICLSD